LNGASLPGLSWFRTETEGQVVLEPTPPVPDEIGTSIIYRKLGRVYPPLAGLSAFGGFIRLWRVYPPLAGLSALGGPMSLPKMKKAVKKKSQPPSHSSLAGVIYLCPAPLTDITGLNHAPSLLTSMPLWSLLTGPLLYDAPSGWNPLRRLLIAAFFLLRSPCSLNLFRLGPMIILPHMRELLSIIALPEPPC
jgi:hypothetical protein